MAKNSLLGNIEAFRDSFFRYVNREFLIFLFFLALSASFWVLMSLNETYEKEITIPVRLVDVPKSVVLTSDTNDTLRVTVRDKGFTLSAYLYGDKIRGINVSFRHYAGKNGWGVVNSQELQKLIYPQLFSSSRIISVKPDKYEFSFNYGLNKRLPVRLNGNILPGKSYYIARVDVEPKYVDVYASKSLLDSIHTALTSRLRIANVADTTVYHVNVKQVRGAKFVPSQIKVTVYPDVLIEDFIEVPVQAVNMPEGKILRTFPPRIKVTYAVGASMFRRVSEDDFKIVVDYNDLIDNPSEKCTVTLKASSAVVRNARLENNQVDYLIEEDNK